MSKPILFVDFNGVISYDPFWKSLENQDHVLHSRREDIEKFLFEDNYELVSDWMVGKYNSEEIHEIIAGSLDIEYSKLFEVFVNDCKEMTMSQPILDQLESIKDRFTLILATGNMDSFDRFTLPNNKYLYDVFDEIHNSFNWGLLKTTNGGEYFQQVIEKYNSNFSESYLIDDSKSTCNIFNELGGTAFRTKTEKEVLEVLRKYLNINESFSKLS